MFNASLLPVRPNLYFKVGIKALYLLPQPSLLIKAHQSPGHYMYLLIPTPPPPPTSWFFHP